MAMKTASPWWFSSLFMLGLGLLFLGERPFDHIDSVRMVFSGVGTVLLLGVTGMRAWSFLSSTGEQRQVERTLLLSQVGVLAALLMYILTTDWGQGVIGVDDLEGKAASRFMVPMTILWAIVLTISLLPMIMVEASLGTARRGGFSLKATSAADQEAVESFRVREMALSGLSIGLALSFLFVTCNVAQQRNIRKDVSYFKTASPGKSTVAIARSVSKPVEVYMFFPQVNKVKNEIRGYFNALQEASGNVVVEQHDNLLSAALAKKFSVKKNGTVVIAYGDKHEKVDFVYEDLDSRRNRKHRTELRELDRTVNATMLKVVKERRNAYLTVGHGEINNSDSEWVKRRVLSGELKKRLSDLNYSVKQLGVTNGLGSNLPEDADLVLMIGPMLTPSDAELASLMRYLDKGGRLLIALDPRSPARLGPLGEYLGVEFNPAPIVDDKQYLMGRIPSRADRRRIKTNRFSSHASVTTLARAGLRYGTAFLEAGSLDEVPFSEDTKNRIKRKYVIRSMKSSFLDIKPNYSFDEGLEKRDAYRIAAAFEDPTAVPDDSPGGAEGAEGAKDKPAHPGMRAMVFADVDIFGDAAQLKLGGAGVLFTDAVKWLGGEEELAGEIVSTRDVVIAHTRNEDALWFYSTIVGAPLAVLGFGLWFGWWRRQRIRRRTAA